MNNRRSCWLSEPAMLQAAAIANALPKERIRCLRHDTSADKLRPPW